MPDQHALLSASSSARWLNCPPSAKLCAELPDVATSYALEGTDAHELCAYLVDTALDRTVADPRENLSFYNEEMQECADDYCQYVLEQVQLAKQHCEDPVVCIEQRLDYSRWVPSGFGTGDCVIIADDLLQIVDFKYGLGVEVSADHNTQMMCYALGALDAFDSLYDIKDIKMTIFQPRKQNVSEWSCSRDELLQWAEETLKPRAELAYKGEGEQAAGAWCRFCKIRNTCRKRAEANLMLAQYDFKLPPELSNEEVAVVLEKLDDLEKWAEDVKKYALDAALSGVEFDGWKVVEGRSNRVFTDKEAVANLVSGEGKDPFKHELLGITDMEKLLGKKHFAELLNGYVEKPAGKPALVPITDKRPAMNTAKDDFANE